MYLASLKKVAPEISSRLPGEALEISPGGAPGISPGGLHGISPEGAVGISPEDALKISSKGDLESLPMLPKSLQKVVLRSSGVVSRFLPEVVPKISLDGAPGSSPGKALAISLGFAPEISERRTPGVSSIAYDIFPKVASRT